MNPQKGYLCLIVVIALLIGAAALSAQEVVRPARPIPPLLTDDSMSVKQNPSFYHLEFAIHEMESGKVINTRNYGLWMSTGEAGNIRAVNEVPYLVSALTTDKPSKAYNYKSVGIQIDGILREIDGNTLLSISGSISDVVPSEKDQDPTVFRSIYVKYAALIPLGKPITISSIDDPTSKRRFQIEVTATKHK